jgi:hypothetical protein
MQGLEVRKPYLRKGQFYISIRARVKGSIIEPQKEIDLLEGQKFMATILIPIDRKVFQRSEDGEDAHSTPTH